MNDMTEKSLILSIDGGGIRGIIPAIILAELEKDLSKSLYETFDMYAGSSVGSWIILAISALQYNSTQLLALFNEPTIQQIFCKRWFGLLSLIHGHKYKGSGKRAVLDHVFQDVRFLSLKKQTLVTAYDLVNNQAVVFKSRGKSSDAAYNPTVAEIADASSAAPTYFPPIETSATPTRWLVDGGIVANDPALCIITEALHAGIELENIKVFSIGSGISDKFSQDPDKFGKASLGWGAFSWLEHGIINDLFSGNTTITEYQATQLLKERYLRINGVLKVDEDPMDNISPNNIQALQETGKAWYQQNREKILAFFRD
jgi:patatin-like phospholipase/acyl hydrolase